MLPIFELLKFNLCDYFHSGHYCSGWYRRYSDICWETT